MSIKSVNKILFLYFKANTQKKKNNGKRNNGEKKKLANRKTKQIQMESFFLCDLR